MNDMKIFFKDNLKAIAYLEKVHGSHIGLKLPLHEGINFIGRAENRCEYNNRDELLGIIEAAQFYIRMDKEISITDATSTYQSKIFRGAKVDHNSYDELCKRKDYILVDHEKYGTPPKNRNWYQLNQKDIVYHTYGCWLLKNL